MSSKITEIITSNEFTYSFEVTPDINCEVLENEILNPLFFSITWHAQMHKCEDLEIAPLKLAKDLRKKGKHVLLHLSCHLLRREYLDNVLAMLQLHGICNLFVILGEGFVLQSSDFPSTKDLIKYIRRTTGSYFCIGVAGFANCDEKFKELKEKVESGADFILTQAFFELDSYKKYLTRCNSIGVTVPVIPGIFSFETETELNSFINLCKVHINDELKERLKDGNGLELIAKLIRDIILNTNTRHFHFFTLNKISRTARLINLLT